MMVNLDTEYGIKTTHESHDSIIRGNSKGLKISTVLIKDLIIPMREEVVILDNSLIKYLR